MPKAAKTKSPFPMMPAEGALTPEAVKENMDRFMAMAGEMTELQRDGLTAAAESARVSAKGAQELNSRSLAYAQTVMSGWVEASKTMTGAKSLQEAVEMQANYSKAAVESFMSEFNAMTSLVADTMREAAQPLNSHAGQFVEKLAAVK